MFFTTTLPFFLKQNYWDNRLLVIDYNAHHFHSLQAIVQCNDDNLERDTQTEDIENSDKWCQHPPEGVRCCGGKFKM